MAHQKHDRPTSPKKDCVRCALHNLRPAAQWDLFRRWLLLKLLGPSFGLWLKPKEDGMYVRIRIYKYGFNYLPEAKVEDPQNSIERGRGEFFLVFSDNSK